MIYLKNTAILSLDRAACTGCSRCTEVCPHGVFAVSDGKASITDRDRCMECGACALNCPADAISAGRGVGCAQALINAIRSGGEPACGSCG